MKLRFPILVITMGFLVSASLNAQIAIGKPSLTNNGERAVVTFSLKNEYDQSLAGARVWVFAVDAAGKVVGNQASWIVGGSESEAVENKPLGKEEKREYRVTVQTNGVATSTKITFSRLVLADGQVLHPSRAVRESKE